MKECANDRGHATIEPVTLPIGAKPARPRVILIALVGVGAAVLIALVTVIVLLVTPHGEPVALEAAPTSSGTPSTSSSPTPRPTPTKTPVAPVVSAPAPVVPAPVAPAPAEPAPVQPAPPQPAPAIPPVIPKPTVDNMAGNLTTDCFQYAYADVIWVTSNANAKSAEMRVTSSGSPNLPPETWPGMVTTGVSSFRFDCTRPITYFKITVTNASGSASGLLTWANGAFQGWSPSN